MKRILSLVVSLFLLILVSVSSIAEEKQSTDKEIRFRDIPWGVNIYELRDKMADIGYGTKNTKIEDFINISSYERRGKLSNNHAYAGGEAGFGLDYSEKDVKNKELFRVAGIDIHSVDAYCIFKVSSGQIDRSPENSRYVQAIYTYFPADNEATFYHLQEKLTALYGDPENHEDPSKYFSSGGNFFNYELSSIWYGANNTYVFIYTEWDVKENNVIDGGIAYIGYGVKGIDDDLNLIQAENERLELEAEKAEEQKRLEESEGSFDGL